MDIHPTALIESGSQLGCDVRVGAYAYIGKHVQLGDRCIVEHHATVDGYTQLGRSNHIYPYSFIGARTHDLKYTGGICSLKIGDNNIFREYVSVHTSTADGSATIIGDRNYILAFSHIGHDCRLENDIIMSAQVATGGHVQIENGANIGGHASIHQFCRIGSYAMLGAHSFLKKDLPPFMIACGSPAIAKAYNRIGTDRKGFSESDRQLIKQLFKLLYETDLNRSQALIRIQALSNLKDCPHVASIFFDFVKKNSMRGLI